MLPEELRELCDKVDEVEQLLGSDRKEPIKDELAIRDVVRDRFKQVIKNKIKDIKND